MAVTVEEEETTGLPEPSGHNGSGTGSEYDSENEAIMGGAGEPVCASLSFSLADLSQSQDE